MIRMTLPDNSGSVFYEGNENSMLTVTHLGQQGDGIAKESPQTNTVEKTGDKEQIHYIPFTLPGECVEQDEASSSRYRLITTSPHRQPAQCAHYTRCGGCVLQHAPQHIYEAFKKERVISAFQYMSGDVKIEGYHQVAPRSRRRATLSMNTEALGFHQSKSQAIQDITDGTCAILSEAINNVLPNIKGFLKPYVLPQKEARITVTKTDTGLDMAVSHIKPIPAQAISALIELMQANKIARFSANGETVAELQKSVVSIDGVKLPLPTAGFLQAVESAEQEMIAFVREKVGGAKNIADLFCGSGTFTIPLSFKATVAAIEGDGSALNALTQAMRHTSGRKPVTTLKRDLERSPLSTVELNQYDAIVLDPPYAGAWAQSQKLATSEVPTVVMVSCNPTTAARDVKVLLDGGYKLETIKVIDQFLWSAHVELIVHLTKKRQKR